MRTLIVAPETLSQALMTQPLLARLRRLDPQGALHVLAPSQLVPVFECMADVDKILVQTPQTERHRVSSRLSLACQVLRLRLDRAWVLSSTQRLPWLSRLTGVTVQYLDPSQALARLSTPPSPAHESARAALPWQRRATDPRPHFPRSSLRRHPIREAQARHRAGLPPEAPLLAMVLSHPGGAQQRWPKRHWASLLIRAQREWPGLHTVLLGDPHERCDATEISTLSGGHPAIVCRNVDLGERLALLAQAQAVIAHAGEWAEAAAAFGQPVVLADTSPEAVWARLYRNLECRAARKLR